MCITSLKSGIRWVDLDDDNGPFYEWTAVGTRKVCNLEDCVILRKRGGIE